MKTQVYLGLAAYIVFLSVVIYKVFQKTPKNTQKERKSEKKLKQ